MSAFHILLVEDNEADILLTTELFVQIGMNHTLSVARDGAEAIDYVLKKRKIFQRNYPKFNFIGYQFAKSKWH